MYIRDKVSSVTRPVKGFKRISLEKGETKTVNFEIIKEKLQFYDLNMDRVVEPGDFDIMVGASSVDFNTLTLTVSK